MRRVAVAAMAAIHLALGAAGAPPSSELPDLSAVRAKVYAGEYAKAVAQLTALTHTVQHAEVYNLLGYSLRQLKRYDEAGRWYREALLYDPEHRPALEYQGELFLALGDVANARKNLRYLELLCTTRPCAEYELLKKAIATSKAASAAR
ncbi:tetratricopeptide repeat protein [Hydrogenophaga sp. 2FB]|uniref:tetratricopeptide repeat protein n=1 Tax=Hydrogenophaga sp. 2FB TaxID=2502187 RepID=UPI001BB1A55A|nr:tetratricopeptide repeat protein [Hydrogenophaga sp. 2FB]